MDIQTEHIAFGYHRSAFAISDLSLKAAGGALTGIIGANGSGKTTLLKLMAGLMKPDSGRVLLDGLPLHALGELERARRVAFLPQSYRPAFEFTVEQTVLMGRIPYRGLYGAFEREEDLAAAGSAMQAMDVAAYANTPVTQLSGGEVQRVMIARALAQDTAVLLLDEPQSHLDIAHQYSVLRTLRDYTRNRGLTVVASLHDLNLASLFCDYLAVMAGGRLLCTGAPAQVLTQPVLAQAFGISLEIHPDAYHGNPAVRYYNS